jgi:hypothetical protein
LRPGNEITAAPFFDGTYHPRSRNPSEVVKETSSWAAPTWSAGTKARAEWVSTYATRNGATKT